MWKERLIVRGFGLNSCGSFVEAQRSDKMASLMYGNWLAGYLTAINRTTPGIYDIVNKVDHSGLMQWIENYCNQNPLKSFSDAVETLVIELYPKRTTTAPK